MVKSFAAVFISFLLLSLSGSADAFVWFWSRKELSKEDRIPQPVLQIQAVESPGQVGPLARIASDRNVFVVCSECPASSPLEREMREVAIAVRMRPKNEPVLETGSTAAADPILALNSQYQFPGISPVTAAKSSIKSSGMEHAAGQRTSCLDPPVYFEFNSAEISQSETDRLKEAIAVLKGGKEVEVFGYTCDIGSKKYNDDLAIRRANAVAQVLEEMGIAGIRVKAEGKCCYVSDDQAKNRRVEITCVKGEQKGE